MYKNTTTKRDEELRRRFRYMLNSGVNRQFCNWNALVHILAGQGAPCFYISPKMAEQYVIHYKRGEFIKTTPIGMAMIIDLAENYDKIKADDPNIRHKELWELLVEQPAKSFYMKESTIKHIVYGHTRPKSK